MARARREVAETTAVARTRARARRQSNGGGAALGTSGAAAAARGNCGTRAAAAAARARGGSAHQHRVPELARLLPVVPRLYDNGLPASIPPAQHNHHLARLTARAGDADGGGRRAAADARGGAARGREWDSGRQCVQD